MENAWPAHIERNSLKSRLASITMWTNCWPAHWHKFDLKKNKMHCRSVDGQLGPWPFKYLLQTEFVWWTFLFFLLFCSVLHVTGCSWFTGPLVQESQRSQSKHESTSNAHVDSRQRGYEIQKLRKSSGALSAVLYRHFDTAIYRQQVCARSEYRTKKIPAKIQKKNRIVKGILALVHTHRLQFSLPHEIYATYRYRLTFISSSAAAANAAVATTTAIASTNSKSWLKDFSCVFKIFATELSTRTPEFWLISSSHSSFVVLHNLFAEKKAPRRWPRTRTNWSSWMCSQPVPLPVWCIKNSTDLNERLRYPLLLVPFNLCACFFRIFLRFLHINFNRKTLSNTKGQVGIQTRVIFIYSL